MCSYYDDPTYRNYNPPVTLCINGCRDSTNPAICIHTNPQQPRVRIIPGEPSMIAASKVSRITAQLPKRTDRRA